MLPTKQLISRLWNSTVVWSWVFNGLRLSSVLILLPLLTRLLTEADLGFYMLLAMQITFVQLLDLGFLPAISRSVSYATAGARELKAHGMESSEHNLGTPNYPLLWQLLSTTRALYQRLSIGVLLLMGAWGTFAVGLKIEQTSDPRQAWIAWSLTLAGTVFEMYSGWWNTYLRGLNQVLVSTRIRPVRTAAITHRRNPADRRPRPAERPHCDADFLLSSTQPVPTLGTPVHGRQQAT